MKFVLTIVLLFIPIVYGDSDWMNDLQNFVGTPEEKGTIHNLQKCLYPTVRLHFKI